MRARALVPAAASFFAYAVITAIVGREVIAQVSTAIAHDPGDPLLTAAILHWNAHHIPWTDAWWQFPIFHPTRDTLLFSEHLLGLSPIASPVAWVTRNPLATYNVTMLLTFPLAAIATYALVNRLTRSAAAAFIAGLALAFAPYRMAHLPHIQILALFWAPLALLGLHGFLDSRGRRWPWLVLYGAAWALQGASNGYALVFFTTLVGLWVLWFVVARHRWADLAAIAAATAVASVPLIPILYKYVAVHATHGFERGLVEMQIFSADLAAVLCAPETLSFWSWVKVGCRAEGELFPGVVIFAAFVVAIVMLMRDERTRSRAVTRATRLLAGIAVVYALLAAMVVIVGPMRLEMGVLRLSLSSLDKLVLISLAAGLAALFLALAVRATSASSTIAFYIFGASVTWLLALGPTITIAGKLTGRSGPFALLAALPGAGGLRVPARFWMMTMLCLAIVAGLCVGRLLRGRSRGVAAAAALIVGLGVLADGWTPGIPVQPPPPRVPDPSILRNQKVLTLPAEPFPDIWSTWRAATEGWRAVNGYSGNAPRYYGALASAAALEDDALFEIFRGDSDLHVVVTEEAAPRMAFVERQPGAAVTARGGGVTQYRLPRQAPPPIQDAGTRIRVAAVQSSCMHAELSRLQDGDDRSQWGCPPDEDQLITIDLGRLQQVGAVVYGLGRYHWEYATQMSVETSTDGESWTPARSGSILGDIIRAGLQQPRSMPVMLAFPSREARYIRMRPINQNKDFRWSIAELQVWSGPAA